MALPTQNICPRCKGHHVVEAPPVTRTTQSGRKQIVAHRLVCVSCAYQDRVQMFRGALNISPAHIDDGYRPPLPDEE